MENPAYTAIERSWKVAVGSVVTAIQVYVGVVLIISPTYEWAYQRLRLGEAWRDSVTQACKATPRCQSVSIDQGMMFAPVPNRPWQWPGGVMTVVTVQTNGPAETIASSLMRALPDHGSHVAYRTTDWRGGK